MPKTAHTNPAALFQDYKQAMTEVAERLADEYMMEVQSAMRTDGARSDVTKESADSDTRNYIVRKIVGGALAVMDSWGTGSKMDTSNPALNAYLSSGLYNPARAQKPGEPIRGRPAGSYENVFGETVESSGALEGINLEKLPDSPITAQSPSGAFQDADSWLIASNKVWEEVDKATKAFLLTQIRRRWTFG